MGSFCKNCDQRIIESKNEIIGDINESYSSYINRKNKIEKIKEKVKLKPDKNFKEFIPEIIFLQRNIKKFLSRKKESNQDLFYKKVYSNDINNNNKLIEELDITNPNDTKRNRLNVNDNYKTLSQKYNTLSNNSLINYTEGKQYIK